MFSRSILCILQSVELVCSYLTQGQWTYSLSMYLDFWKDTHENKQNICCCCCFFVLILVFRQRLFSHNENELQYWNMPKESKVLMGSVLQLYVFCTNLVSIYHNGLGYLYQHTPDHSSQVSSLIAGHCPKFRAHKTFYYSTSPSLLHNNNSSNSSQ